jgi:hypothetical protein
VNLVPIDPVLDYMLLSYLKVRADLRVMIRPA